MDFNFEVSKTEFQGLNPALIKKLSSSSSLSIFLCALTRSRNGAILLCSNEEVLNVVHKEEVCCMETIIRNQCYLNINVCPASVDEEVDDV